MTEMGDEELGVHDPECLVHETRDETDCDCDA